jgi:hypothetical protein
VISRSGFAGLQRCVLPWTGAAILRPLWFEHPEGQAADTWKHADGRLQIRLPWTSASRMVEIHADSL